MNLASEAPQWLAVLLSFALVVAALEDAWRLRISNVICLLVVIGAVVAAALAGPQFALWQNLLVFAAVLAAGTPLFALGKFGGGDIKLLACTGLWFSLYGALQMILAVFIAGGALAIVILAARLANWSGRTRERVRLLKPGSGIPYGVAIAAGALTAIWTQRLLLGQ